MVSFIKCVSEILGPEVSSFCTFYVDDVLVYSRSPEEHCQCLEYIFQRLIARNVKLKLSKCNLFKQTVKFLGTL